MIKNALNTLSYTIYPKRCKLCGEVIRAEDELCEECKSEKRITGEICIRCGREKDGCTCKKDKFSPRYKEFCAPYYYGGSIERGINRLKSGGFYELAEGMGEAIYKTVSERYKDIRFDYVTCIPMRKGKERRRGYNQSELLAKAVSKRLGVKYKPFLKKVYGYSSQRYLGPEERKRNIYATFDLLKDEDAEGKTILLVDDVKTTGSTLSEAAAMLRIYGATVYATSLAVTKLKKKER